MRLHFDIKPVVLIAKTKEEVMRQVTEYVDDFTPSWVEGNGILQGCLVPNWLTPVPQVRLYVLQKFNAKYKKNLVVEHSKPGKKVWDVNQIREAQWQAGVYDFDVSVILAMNAFPVQHDRHFEFVSLRNK